MCVVYNNRIEIINHSIGDEIQLNYKVKEADNTNLALQDVSFFLRDNEARLQGLRDIVNHIDVIVDGSSFQKLHTVFMNDDVVKLALQLTVNNVTKASVLLRSDILNPQKKFVYIRPSVHCCCF